MSKKNNKAGCNIYNMQDILKSLKAKNDPADAELIAYYERMMPIWSAQVIGKALLNVLG